MCIVGCLLLWPSKWLAATRRQTYCFPPESISELSRPRDVSLDCVLFGEEQAWKSSLSPLPCSRARSLRLSGISLCFSSAPLCWTCRSPGFCSPLHHRPGCMTCFELLLCHVVNIPCMNGDVPDLPHNRVEVKLMLWKPLMLQWKVLGVGQHSLSSGLLRITPFNQHWWYSSIDMFLLRQKEKFLKCSHQIGFVVRLVHQIQYLAPTVAMSRVFRRPFSCPAYLRWCRFVHLPWAWEGNWLIPFQRELWSRSLHLFLFIIIHPFQRLVPRHTGSPWFSCCAMRGKDLESKPDKLEVYGKHECCGNCWVWVDIRKWSNP